MPGFIDILLGKKDKKKKKKKGLGAKLVAEAKGGTRKKRKRLREELLKDL